MKIEPVVLRSHYDDAGNVERIEVVEAPLVSMISAELLATMDRRYLQDDDVLVLSPTVRYRIGAAANDHGDRFLHRLINR
jgi:hypothetical protein